MTRNLSLFKMPPLPSTDSAFHEGQLFEWPNQVIGVVTTMGLTWMGLSTSVVFVLLTVGGCGSDRIEGGAEARVTVAGEPVVDVQVNVFSMQDGRPVELGFAASRADGKLSFVKPDAAGPLFVEPGEYRFTVEPIGAPLVVPKEYGNPETTPLQVTVPSPGGITLTLPEPKQQRR